MEEGNSKHILILGKHQYMVENLQQLLSKAGYKVAGFHEVEKALEEYKNTDLDMLVFTGAVSPNDFSDMLKWKEEQFPQSLVFEHHGGPATLVDEINAAFAGSGK
jgi:DNA-binding NtrC family response regulator